MYNQNKYLNQRIQVQLSCSNKEQYFVKVVALDSISTSKQHYVISVNEQVKVGLLPTSPQNNKYFLNLNKIQKTNKNAQELWTIYQQTVSCLQEGSRLKVPINSKNKIDGLSDKQKNINTLIKLFVLSSSQHNDGDNFNLQQVECRIYKYYMSFQQIYYPQQYNLFNLAVLSMYKQRISIQKLQIQIVQQKYKKIQIHLQLKYKKYMNKPIDLQEYRMMPYRYSITPSYITMIFSYKSIYLNPYIKTMKTINNNLQSSQQQQYNQDDQDDNGNQQSSSQQNNMVQTQQNVYEPLIPFGEYLLTYSYMDAHQQMHMLTHNKFINIQQIRDINIYQIGVLGKKLNFLNQIYILNRKTLSTIHIISSDILNFCMHILDNREYQFYIISGRTLLVRGLAPVDHTFAKLEQFIDKGQTIVKLHWPNNNKEQNQPMLLIGQYDTISIIYRTNNQIQHTTQSIQQQQQNIINYSVM